MPTSRTVQEDIFYIFEHTILVSACHVMNSVRRFCCIQMVKSFEIFNINCNLLLGCCAAGNALRKVRERTHQN